MFIIVEVYCWFVLCDNRMVVDLENFFVLSVFYVFFIVYFFFFDKVIDDVSIILCIK